MHRIMHAIVTLILKLARNYSYDGREMTLYQDLILQRVLQEVRGWQIVF